MKNGTDGCFVGGGGFFFFSVESTDGGQEFLFWVSLLQVWGISEGLSPELTGFHTSFRVLLLSFLLMTWAAGFEE